MLARARTRTRIIATVGPASEPPAMVARLIEAGVSIFRLNFSHGALADNVPRIETIRAAAKAAGTPIAILGDLPGPKIRLGTLPPDGIELSPGQDVVIDPALTTAEIVPRHPARLPSTYARIGLDVKPGQRVLINDGAVRLLAVEKARADAAGSLRARVIVGGKVSSGKGINLPESTLEVPALTDRDWECARFAVEHDLDFLALSFVRSAAEILELKRRLADHMRSTGAPEGSQIPIVAKIEKPQAVERMEEIIAVADAVMVARGDLGVEMELAQVPAVQKRLIAAAGAHGRTCIVATQMLESMIESATPTRAEASDVANAVLDGADAVMLSGETAVGRHPALVVETMRRIIEAAEATIPAWAAAPSPPGKVVETGFRTAALADGAWHIARDIEAVAVVCWSQRGGGAARHLSQTGFEIPIVACTSAVREARRMSMLRGVTPMISTPPADGTIHTWASEVSTRLVESGIAAVGDAIVLMTGTPVGAPGAATQVMVHYIDAQQRTTTG